jgi:hypothetical protein
MEELKTIVNRVKVRIITNRLAQFGGNITHSAASLGVHRNSLARMLKELNAGKYGVNNGRMDEAGTGTSSNKTVPGRATTVTSHH